MIRFSKPFIGKRFLLNTNTNEVHDLEKETPSCKIDEIKHEHIIMFDTELAAYVYQQLNTGISNGCKNCKPDTHTN